MTAFKQFGIKLGATSALMILVIIGGCAKHIETKLQVDYNNIGAYCDSTVNPPGVPRLVPFATITRGEPVKKSEKELAVGSYLFVPGSLAVAIESETIDDYSARCGEMLSSRETQKAKTPAVKPKLVTPEQAAPSPAQKKVAVYELTPSGKIDAAFVEKLTASLAAAAAKRHGISASVSKAIPEFERKRLVVGCDDTACIGEIGTSLGVDAVISGSVILLDDGTWYLSLLLIDAKQPKILSRATVKEKDRDQLLGRIDWAADELLKKTNLEPQKK